MDADEVFPQVENNSSIINHMFSWSICRGRLFSIRSVVDTSWVDRAKLALLIDINQNYDDDEYFYYTPMNPQQNIVLVY